MQDFIDQQLADWPEAAANYLQLCLTERRTMQLDSLPVAVQHNPARIRSTGADVSRQAIQTRPCFLCNANRPRQQRCLPILPGWDVLLNPFPIFPVHFTIASLQHRPQGRMPLDMVAFVEKMPRLAAFFNGAFAGASAPDHEHFQAVLKSELPLLSLAERLHPCSPGASSSYLMIRGSEGVCPFTFASFIILPDNEGMRLLSTASRLCGFDQTGNPNPGLVNDYVWIDDSGVLRIVVIPRRAHRPACYGKDADPHFLISPGAVDMAGVIISPREEDFRNLSADDIRRIYSDVAYSDEL